MDERKTTILYMEDDPGLGRLLQKTLGRIGYHIDVASTAEEGLKMLEESAFDIVLADYNLPGISGMDVIGLLSQQTHAPPVIMVTGNGNERVAVEAMKLGATDYVVKDVDMGYLELLPMVIEQVLQKQELLREKERMFAVIQESEERYRRLVELSPDGIAICVGDELVFVNPAGVRLLGYMRFAELVGRAAYEFVHPDDRAIFAEQVRRVQDSGESLPWVEERFVCADGTGIDVEVSGGPFVQDGKPAVQMIFRDITERKLAKERLEQMAHFDGLTGLPNRLLFFDRLNITLTEAKRYGNMFALLFIDLDRFKQVNDTLGHDAGDLVLKRVADRLRESVRGSDTVARMGGDEFTIVLGKILDGHDAELVAEKVISAIAQPFALAGDSFVLGASIGISIYPADGDTSELLLKKADKAMYSAKSAGSNRYALYREDLCGEASGRSFLPVAGSDQ